MKKTSFLSIMVLPLFIIAQPTKYQELLKYYNAEKNFNGVAMVATNGQIGWLNGIGISSRQAQTTINSKSKFKIASITKTFTAVLILQLMEQGKIDLDSTIGKYLPEYMGEAKNKVTIENLLTYSSGIPNCESYIGDEIYQRPITKDVFIKKYCSGNLVSAPGSTFSYDNGDYVLLGSIIEKITGKSFEENLQQQILSPLNMLNTAMLSSRDIIPGLVPSYTYNDSVKTFGADKPYYIENFFSAGAMYSTGEDLLKFDQGIFTYKILNKKTVGRMLAPHPKLQNVGLGFWIAEKYGALDTKFAYRPGGIYGSTANWIHVLDSNRTIIALSNTNATNLFEFSQQLHSIATGKNTVVPKVTGSAVTPITHTEDLKGVWTIDLRPTPTSEAYFRDFVIRPAEGEKFSGEFYGTAFTNGKFNTGWGNIYFAFTTADKDNVYYHSGYIDGNKIIGISFSPDRQFISHWTGMKKTSE